MLAGAALAAISVGACSDPRGPTTIRLWALGREGEVVGALVRDFERAHPEIRVEVQQLPFMSAHEKMLTAFVGDATPDLAQLGNTWVPELAALGALAPLDEWITASSIVDGADYFSGIWGSNEIDGVRYGVPWYVDTRLVFYRKDLFAAAGIASWPASWSAWRDTMRAVKASITASGGDGRFAILLPLDEYEQLLTLALSSDEPVLRDHGRYGNFRSAGFRGALTFYLETFVEGLAPMATQVQVPNPWSELSRGYFASFFHGPWSIGEFKRRLPPEQQALWETAPVPGPNGAGASIAGGSSLVVFRASAHPREAWQLIEYLSRPAVQRQFYDLTGDLPPRRSTWNDARLTEDGHIRAFRDQLERMRRVPPVPEWERIATEMRIMSERAARRVSAATTPAQLAAIVDAAVSELDARVDQMLEKRRWMLARRGAP
jgi:multiple sugar transport system substrate-binding protein